MDQIEFTPERLARKVSIGPDTRNGCRVWRRV